MDKKLTEEYKNQIDFSRIPAHVAIIMDGNGRWARSRNLARIKGHAQGGKIIRGLTETAARTGVKVLTLYCFSTENWSRPEEEINFLMDLFYRYLKEQVEDMVRLGVHLHTIGDTSKLPERVQKELAYVKERTEDCDVITLNLALNYGSRDEIVHGVKTIGKQIQQGLLNPDAITEEIFSESLYTANLPDPELMIRTSGELRLSNYLLWQLAYAEFYFTDVNWPDFDDGEFYKAIVAYQSRHRRFGGLVEGK